MTKIELDEGFYYGIGLFETLAVEQEKPVFWEQHIRRLRKGLEVLSYSAQEVEDKVVLIKEKVYGCDVCRGIHHGMLKIMVSAKNVVVKTGPNPYEEKDYEQGFRLCLSNVVRNETSPFTYLKSFHYGDNLWEKRAAKKRGFHEPIFLNTKGQLTEGAVSNIFLRKQDTLYTPAVSCGILPGIMREWIMEHNPVVEGSIYPREVGDFDEVFVTNSLMGIMPVIQFEDYKFSSSHYAEMLIKQYHMFIGKYYGK